MKKCEEKKQENKNPPPNLGGARGGRKQTKKRNPISIFSYFFIVFLLSLGFIAESAHAVYSPTIYQHVQIAKSHIKASRARNGAGTVANAWDKWMADEKTALAKDKYRARVLPPNYSDAVSTIKNFKIAGAIALVWDDWVASFNVLFGWIVGDPISACVRNDIFELEDLIEKVSGEMIRTGILFDDVNYLMLKNDFETLQDDIAYLRNHPEDPPINVEGSDTKMPYLFPDDGINYYLAENCPVEEWKPPVKQFVEDFNYFIEAVKNIGRGGAWGSISEMAEARAKRKASDWFKKNQLSISIGGESGARTISLKKTGGILSGLGGYYNDVVDAVVEDIIGPPVELVGMFFDSSVTCAIYDPVTKGWRQCKDEGEDGQKSEVQLYDECEELFDNNATDIPAECRYFANPNRESTSGEIVNRKKKSAEARLKDLERATRAIQYQLRFQSVAEESLIDFDATLFELGSQIKYAYNEQVGPSLPTIIENFSFLENKYCGNRPPPAKSQ